MMQVFVQGPEDHAGQDTGFWAGPEMGYRAKLSAQNRSQGLTR